jgi:DNA-binding transcriptional regulator YdaS (Cro superfamily)
LLKAAWASLTWACDRLTMLGIAVVAGSALWRSTRHEQQRRLELVVDRLRKWCLKSRGNIEWVAKQLKVDQSAVSRWVSGQERPRPGNALVIERFLASQNGAVSPLARADELRLARSDCLRLQLRHWGGLAISREKQLTLELGISQQLVSDWLNGRAPIALKHCPAIERLLGVEVARPSRIIQMN